MSIQSITVVEVFEIAESSPITLIDVREPDEFNEVAAEYAENHPLSRFDPVAFAEGRDKSEAIYLICRSGARSMRAADLLSAEGFTNLFNVTGGTNAWVEEDLPVITGD